MKREVLEDKATLAITVDAFEPLHGVTDGIGQPSLKMLVRNADDGLLSDNDLTGLLQQLLEDRVDFVHAASSGTEQYAFVLHQLLTELRYPVFYDPLIHHLGDGRSTVRIAVMAGTHKRVARLATCLSRVFSDHLLKTADALAFPELKRAVDALKMMAPKGKNTLPMVRMAHQLEIPWFPLIAGVFQFGQGKKLHWFDSSLSDEASLIGARLVQDKLSATAILQRSAFPVAVNQSVDSADQAAATAGKIGYPVVVKPVDTDRGIGVTAGLRDAVAVKKAFDNARQFSKRVMVEKMIPGNDYRIHVLRGKAYHVRIRIPASVVGDGKHTIAELVDFSNQNPERKKKDRNSIFVGIKIDGDMKAMLRYQGLDLTSVPVVNRHVQLKSIANVSAGGVSHQVDLLTVHPDNLRMAERAVDLFKLDVAAVDFLCEDITRSWHETGGGICEINAKPQLANEAPLSILNEFFPDGGRIPVGIYVGPVDINGGFDSIISTLADRNLLLGQFNNRRLIVEGEVMPYDLQDGAFGATHTLLKRREIDAILIQADDTFVKFGLPFRQFDFLFCSEPDHYSSDLYQLLARFCDTLFIDTQSVDMHRDKQSMNDKRLLTYEDAGQLSKMISDCLSGDLET